MDIDKIASLLSFLKSFILIIKSFSMIKNFTLKNEELIKLGYQESKVLWKGRLRKESSALFVNLVLSDDGFEQLNNLDQRKLFIS
jgi:hypothetical protein